MTSEAADVLTGLLATHLDLVAKLRNKVSALEKTLSQKDPALSLALSNQS